jgi:hypothetical protein
LRFGSFIESPVDAMRQLFLCETALAAPALAQGVNQSEKLVEELVAHGGFGCRPVQRLEADPPGPAFRVRPDRWEVRAGENVPAQGRRCVRRRHPARDLASYGWKSVPDAVDQELLDGLEQGAASVILAGDEARDGQAP